MRIRRSWASVVLFACAAPASADAPAIQPKPGLVLTTTVHSAVVSGSRGNFGVVDQENLISLVAAGPEGLTYRITMSAPSNKLAQEELRKFKLVRKVRRQDLADSTRMTLLYSSRDPEYYGGQTFTETSTKALEALKTSGATPFVLGPTWVHGPRSPRWLRPRNCLRRTRSRAYRRSRTRPLCSSGLFGSARHYYRGTLHRVEAHDVPFSVLVNGVRENLPAVHAAGSFTFPGEDPVPVQVWFLDNPQYPLNLEYVFGLGTSLITRIDFPVDQDSGAGARGNAGAAGMAAQLASKQCRVELHGIYFNTGSAVLLDESEPMLRQVTALIKASPAARLTIEGHTDNIGSAAYNQDLSERRAEAVRTALVTRYGVPAARLTAKGYGFTRPVESNDTYQGRARNRRVELARDCADGH